MSPSKLQADQNGSKSTGGKSLAAKGVFAAASEIVSPLPSVTNSGGANRKAKNLVKIAQTPP